MSNDLFYFCVLNFVLYLLLTTKIYLMEKDIKSHDEHFEALFEAGIIEEFAGGKKE